MSSKGYRGADLSGKQFSGEDFSGARFDRGSNLSGTTFRDCNFSGARFSGTSLRGVQFPYCSFRGAVLRDVLLDGDFSYSDFQGARVEARIFGATLTRGKFSGADFQGSAFASVRADSANFSRSNLRGVSLRGFFPEADFTGADLSGASFRHSNLRGADFRDADLSGTDFTGSLRAPKNPPIEGWIFESSGARREGEIEDIAERNPFRTEPFDFPSSEGIRTRGIRFYHSSPVRFRRGDLLYGGYGGGSGYAHSNVCLTTTPVPHETIAGNIPGWGGSRPPSDNQVDPQIDRDWYVYEVEPLGRVTYIRENLEYQTPLARVLRNLGKARAFLPREGYLEDSYSYALPPHAERDREKKREERRERHLERIDRRNREAARRVVRAYLRTRD